jgi:hypothetical protein
VSLSNGSSMISTAGKGILVEDNGEEIVQRGMILPVEVRSTLSFQAIALGP